MITVGSYEAKTSLSALLRRVARGQRVTITRHGAPIAMLVPADSTQGPAQPQETIRQLKEFRRGRTLRGITLHRLIREGRRY